MPINLVSDTVTKPSSGMLSAMMAAEVGDDVFGEDPSVQELEAKAAALFGKEAAVFCPSGTMTNQIAINCHTGKLEEIVCNKLSHVYRAEVGGYASNAGAAIKLLEGDDGKLTAEQVAASINPAHDWLPTTRLVVVENTSNLGGGSYYTLNEIRPIHDLCREKSLALHLDGARIFNALEETEENTLAVGKMFDSISLCLSKGLGAPVGSLLLGNDAFIAKARRFRKAMGGGMRQAGYLAAAGIYALDHNIERLRDDHARARALGACLESLSCIAQLRPVQTNIIIFDLAPDFTAQQFLGLLAQKGIAAAAFGPQTVRFVTHLDFTDDMLETTLIALREIEALLLKGDYPPPQ